MADELAQQAQDTEPDLLLARDASPFYLKLSESVLRASPGHLPLAAAVAGGYTQYAFAFVAFDAERLADTDVRAAQAGQARAAALYRRALDHALRALEQRQPGLRPALRVPGKVIDLRRDEVPVAYWAAASWGALIALSKDDPEVLADLPLAQRLAQAAWNTEPSHGRGALASLMGSFEAARPGGELAIARRHFEQAAQFGRDEEAGPYVAMAEALALPAGDRERYLAWLRQAVAIATRHPGLSNAVMRERAEWLLATADQRF